MCASANWQPAEKPLPSPAVKLWRREHWQLGFIILLALVNGLVYVFLVPPWQHYDEPNHFEAVWLAARLDRLPQPGDDKPRLSRRIFQSMLANGFYDRMTSQPALPSDEAQVTTPGYSQLGEPPLYYLLASLPLRVIPRAVSVERQLYAARMVSLGLYLFTVLAAWGAARAVAPPGHALRWLVPATLALLPGFAELMTAVNSDAAAVAVFSLFFWGSLRLVCKPFSWLNLVWVLGAAGLSYFTKNTAMIALALLPVVLLFAFLRGRWQPLAWAILGLGLAVLLASGVAWHDAAAWHRGSLQANPMRATSPAAVTGDHVLALDMPAIDPQALAPPAYQVLPPGEVKTFSGQPVTLGAWMWASQPARARLPALKYSAEQAAAPVVELTTEPQFFALQVDLPPASDRVWIYLAPESPEHTPVRVFFDGLVLVEGRRPVDQPPQFNSPDGSTGDWGGRPFVNLLRNASFEQSSPRVAGWLDGPASNFLPDRALPSQVLATLWDWRRSGYFYRIAARHLFQTFWARFGWGHIPLAWSWVYGLLAGISLLGAIGAAWGAWRLRHTFPWEVAVISGLALLLAWALALARGSVYLHLPFYYYPTARHAYPAILPLVLGLSFGWWEWLRRLRWGAWLFFIFFAFLNLLSFFSIARFYGRS